MPTHRDHPWERDERAATWEERGGEGGDGRAPRSRAESRPATGVALLRPQARRGPQGQGRMTKASRIADRVIWLTLLVVCVLILAVVASHATR